MATLVLTVLGDDRTGLVAALSAPLQAHGAGWENSRMARLAGKFAGIVEVVVPDANADALVDELAALRQQGLHVTVERTDEPAGPGAAVRLRLDLVGADRPGIVAEISALLAERGIGVEELSTATSSAPMAGGVLFEANATLSAAPGSDTAALRAALETLADELMVEVTLADEGPVA